MAEEDALRAGDAPGDETHEQRLYRIALEMAREATHNAEEDAQTILQQRETIRRLEAGRGGTHMEESWARGMEARMVKVETEIKALAPVVMVREMVENVQRDVRDLTHSVRELTNSDLELKELHKELMVDRAKREEETHRKELQEKEAQIELLKAQKAKTGTLVFITQKAQPVTSFVIAVGAVVGLLYGFYLWWSQHFTK